MIEKILLTIENQKMTITGWIYGFIGILFVRFLLESISSPTFSGVISSDPYTLVHYGLFFLTVTLGTIIIFGYITRDYKAASKFILFGLPLIWLAPIIDIIVSRGEGFKMTYIFHTGTRLFLDFFTFFGSEFARGATIGIRVGIALSILGIGYLIWIKTKKISGSLYGMLLVYLFVFLIAVLPGLIYTVIHLNLLNLENAIVINYFEKIILNSTISHNTLHEGISSVSNLRFLELGFNKLFSQILFLISFILATILLWKSDTKKFWSVLRNARPERINFYTASLFCGIGFAYINRLGNPFTYIDILGILCLLIAWVSLWMQAVHLNDVHDVDIDRISNTNRPIIRNELDSFEMKDIGVVWLSLGLVGAWSAGFYPFFMSLVYLACSFIYSAPPLRLRRFPLVPSFLIGVACLSTILAGYFFVSEDKELQNFPTLLAVGIVIMVTLAINFKDIKDIEGDKENEIMTIPVIFPNSGIKIVASLFALSILLVPIFLSFYLLYIISIPSAIIGYRIITKKPYTEKHIFTLRFFFMGGIVISYLIIFWLADVYNLA